MSWSPVVTSGTGTPTTTTKTANYIVTNSSMQLSIGIKVNNKGTASGAMDFTTPFAFLDTNWALSGVENFTTGALCIGYAQVGKVRLYKYDVTTLWVNNYNVATAGTINI